MYAIIRAGGKQAKVQAGDVIEIERVKDGGDALTFIPLLVVGDDGQTVSDRSILSDSKVVAEVMGETQGDKIDIFKYKNKTGYRRHMGHRQKYTQIRVTSIDVPGVGRSEREAPSESTRAERASEAPMATATAQPAGASKTRPSGQAISKSKPAAKAPGAKKASRPSTKKATTASKATAASKGKRATSKAAKASKKSAKPTKKSAKRSTKKR